jgi:hypothetical protein
MWSTAIFRAVAGEAFTVSSGGLVGGDWAAVLGEAMAGRL